MAGRMGSGESGSSGGGEVLGASRGLGLLPQVRWEPQRVVGRGTCPDLGVHRYHLDAVAGGQAPGNQGRGNAAIWAVEAGGSGEEW